MSFFPLCLKDLVAFILFIFIAAHFSGMVAYADELERLELEPDSVSQSIEDQGLMEDLKNKIREGLCRKLFQLGPDALEVDGLESTDKVAMRTLRERVEERVYDVFCRTSSRLSHSLVLKNTAYSPNLLASELPRKDGIVDGRPKLSKRKPQTIRMMQFHMGLLTKTEMDILENLRRNELHDMFCGDVNNCNPDGSPKRSAMVKLAKIAYERLLSLSGSDLPKGALVGPERHKVIRLLVDNLIVEWSEAVLSEHACYHSFSMERFRRVQSAVDDPIRDSKLSDDLIIKEDGTVEEKQPQQENAQKKDDAKNDRAYQTGEKSIKAFSVGTRFPIAGESFNVYLEVDASVLSRLYGPLRFGFRPQFVLKDWKKSPEWSVRLPSILIEGVVFSYGDNVFGVDLEGAIDLIVNKRNPDNSIDKKLSIGGSGGISPFINFERPPGGSISAIQIRFPLLIESASRLDPKMNGSKPEVHQVPSVGAHVGLVF